MQWGRLVPTGAADEITDLVKRQAIATYIYELVWLQKVIPDETVQNSTAVYEETGLLSLKRIAELYKSGLSSVKAKKIVLTALLELRKIFRIDGDPPTSDQPPLSLAYSPKPIPTSNKKKFKMGARNPSNTALSRRAGRGEKSGLRFISSKVR